MGSLQFVSIFLLCIIFSSASEFLSKIDDNTEVKKIFEKLAELQNGLDEMRKENTFLKENIRSLHRENQNFRETIDSLAEKCDRFELEKLKMNAVYVKSGTLFGGINTTTNSSLKNKNYQTYPYFTTQRSTTEAVPEMTKYQKESMDRDSSLIKARGLQSEKFSSIPTVSTKLKNIGFLAYNPMSQLDLRIKQTVLFPTALTNEGSAYDPSKSIFTAPADGLYFFSVTILSLRGEDMEAEIVHNGNGKAYTYSGSETMYGSGTTSVVLHLHANDNVWIRILNNKVENSGVIRIHGDRWSTFSGFKIA